MWTSLPASSINSNIIAAVLASGGAIVVKLFEKWIARKSTSAENEKDSIRDELRADNIRLQRENRKLRKESEDFRKKEIEQLQEEITELQHTLDERFNILDNKTQNSGSINE